MSKIAVSVEANTFPGIDVGAVWKLDVEGMLSVGPKYWKIELTCPPVSPVAHSL
jgi:hypothetical protein